MRNSLTLLTGIIIVMVLLAYMFAFQVRYDEVAVLTTFDKATPPTRNADGAITEPGSLRIKAGLYTRLPWPIQKVYHYPTLVQMLQDQLEEQQTADGYAVIVQTYLAWRIDDPLAFFINVKNIDSAQSKLMPLLRTEVSGVIGRYRFNQLVNTDASQLKIVDIEKEATEQLRKQVADQGYGIRIEQVGLRRLVLPEKVTEKVFERMKATRQRMAAAARAEGAAEAGRIISVANTARDRILAHTQRRAQDLRALGDTEAASYYSVFGKNPKLANQLEQIRKLPEMLKGQTTIVGTPALFGIEPPGSLAVPLAPAAAPLSPPAPLSPAANQPQAVAPKPAP